MHRLESHTRVRACSLCDFQDEAGRATRSFSSPEVTALFSRIDECVPIIQNQKWFTDAEAALRLAIRLRPTNRNTWLLLQTPLARQQRLSEARTASPRLASPAYVPRHPASGRPLPRL